VRLAIKELSSERARLPSISAGRFNALKESREEVARN
jgi:hypothetical protein